MNYTTFSYSLMNVEIPIYYIIKKWKSDASENGAILGMHHRHEAFPSLQTTFVIVGSQLYSRQPVRLAKLEQTSNNVPREFKRTTKEVPHILRGAPVPSKIGTLSAMPHMSLKKKKKKHSKPRLAKTFPTTCSR